MIISVQTDVSLRNDKQIRIFPNNIRNELKKLLIYAIKSNVDEKAIQGIKASINKSRAPQTVIQEYKFLIRDIQANNLFAIRHYGECLGNLANSEDLPGTFKSIKSFINHARKNKIDRLLIYGLLLPGILMAKDIKEMAIRCVNGQGYPLLLSAAEILKKAGFEDIGDLNKLYIHDFDKLFATLMDADINGKIIGLIAEINDADKAKKYLKEVISRIIYVLDPPFKEAFLAGKYHPKLWA